MRNLRKDIVSRSSVARSKSTVPRHIICETSQFASPSMRLSASPGFLVLEKLPWYLLWQPGHNKPCPRFFRLLCKLG